jgi:hypothetical protein
MYHELECCMQVSLLYVYIYIYIYVYIYDLLCYSIYFVINNDKKSITIIYFNNIIV